MFQEVGVKIVPISKRLFSELNWIIHMEYFLEEYLVQIRHLSKFRLGLGFYLNVFGLSLGR